MFHERWGEVPVWVEDAPDVLERLVASEAGISAANVIVAHHCANCGSSSHGAPFVELPKFVSRSRAAGFTAAAVGPFAIGVDIESLTRLSGASVDAVLLHPEEAAEFRDLHGEERLRRLGQLWTAKEAVLKLARTGLRIDPACLHLTRSASSFELVGWPSELGFAAPPVLQFFDVSADLVGCLAVG